VLIFVFPVLMGAWSFPWEGFWHNYQGQKSYDSKEYPRAEKHFSKGLKAAPKNPKLQYNQGNGFYRSEQYDKAIQAYQNSAQAKQLDDQKKAQSLYNLGNSFYRQGQKSQNNQEDWKKAVEAYQEALKINPQDKEAQDNLGFVQKQIEQQAQKNQSGKQQKNQNKQDKQPSQETPKSEQKKDQSQANNSNDEKTEPPENHFTDQALQSRLQEIQANENKHRQQTFRRTPPSKQRNPIDDLLRKDDSIKDW